MRLTSYLIAAAMVCVSQAAIAETPLQKETSIWQAFKDKKADAFGSMLAADYVGLYNDGPATRAKELDSLKASKIDSFKIENFASHAISPNDILTNYVVDVKGSIGKEDASGRYYAASLWHGTGAKWLTSYHTEIKAK